MAMKLYTLNELMDRDIGPITLVSIDELHRLDKHSPGTTTG